MARARVEWDASTTCNLTYAGEKDVVPGVPAFLEAATTHLSCDVTVTVSFTDVDDRFGVTAEDQARLMEAGTPLLAHQLERLHVSAAATVWLPDFYFLRSNGFTESTFGDPTLTELGVHSQSQLSPAPAGVTAAAAAAAAELRTIREHWRSKNPKVFWRGGANGRGECGQFPRVRLVQAARDIPGLDVGIVRNEYFCTEGKLNKLGVKFVERVEEAEWDDARAIVDIDGVGNAWGRYWRLMTGSVVLSVDSPISGFYSHRMLPWVHYVPANMSNLAERVTWILDDANEDAQVRMIAAANRLGRSITFQGEAQRVGRELDAKMCTKRGVLL
eukprot:CAMPEP_0197584120 /NCGR_PEP_ID=MMETSP1326-20131121/6820_1 /TAXON_ID=1155430 /ORGANISM="Genus nov. species nov., Strain RCC2288" /LENGTH=329 /DNA_ID=CAMNT_0043148435 /DNA_START=14 /DNA_END=1003 /DNA_ORIENTATION=-